MPKDFLYQLWFWVNLITVKLMLLEALIDLIGSYYAAPCLPFSASPVWYCFSIDSLWNLLQDYFSDLFNYVRLVFTSSLCLIYVICLAVSSTYCVVFLFCLSSSYVTYFASFSGLSIFFIALLYSLTFIDHDLAIVVSEINFFRKDKTESKGTNNQNYNFFF
jgi:hypothetical protein